LTHQELPLISIAIIVITIIKWINATNWILMEAIPQTLWRTRTAHATIIMWTSYHMGLVSIICWISIILLKYKDLLESTSDRISKKEGVKR